MAAIQLRQAEPQKAIDQLQPIVTAASEDFNAITLLATAYMMANQPAKAAELFDRALKLNPDNVAVRLQLAKTHLTTGDKKLAVSELERVVAASPDSTGASALLVVSLVSDGRLDEADKAAHAFRERASDNPLPPYLLAAVALARKDLTGGRQYLEEALKVDPNFVPAALSLAALDIQAGRKADAKRRYEEVISHAPKSVPAMLGLAQLALEEDDTTSCRSWLDKAAASRSERSACSHRQGRFVAGSGRRRTGAIRRART